MIISDTSPIGIFDSGIGGLTVANAVCRLLPKEKIVYYGDTEHLPYGDKSEDHIRQFSLRIADFLLEKNCKLILIACNTASAAAYEAVKNHVRGKVPVLNVIDPVVQAVASNYKIKKVGIVGTKATIRSATYEQKLKAIRPEIETVSQATALLASMIEAGFYNNSVSRAVINSYLAYPDFSDIDSMILACTHYPLIRKEVSSFFHNRVLIFDSTEPTAERVFKVLQENDLLNEDSHASHEFYVSDFTESFQQTTKLFFEGLIHLEEYNLWEKT